MKLGKLILSLFLFIGLTGCHEAYENPDYQCSEVNLGILVLGIIIISTIMGVGSGVVFTKWNNGENVTKPIIMWGVLVVVLVLILHSLVTINL